MKNHVAIGSFVGMLLLLALRMAAGQGYFGGNEPTPISRTIHAHDEAVHSLAFFPDGQKFVSGSRDGSAKVWELKSGRLLHTILGHDGAVFAVAVSEDGKYIATGGADHTVRVWDANTYEQLYQLEGHSGEVRGVAFLDADQIVSGGGDGVRVWDFRKEKLLWKWRGQTGRSVFAMSLAKEKKRLAVAGGSGALSQVIDLAARKVLCEFGLRFARDPCIAISPDGSVVYVRGDVGHEWSAYSADDGKMLPAPKDWQYLLVAGACCTPDGKSLVVSDIGVATTVWDRQTMMIRQRFVEPPRIPAGRMIPDAVAVSPDGKTLLIGGGGWEMEDGWHASTENYILVYPLGADATRNAKPEGVVSWDVIPCKIKTLGGQTMAFEDWEYHKGGIIGGPMFQRLTDHVDAWLSPQAILFYRGGDTLQEVLADQNAMYHDLVWDGKNAWVSTLHSGIFILDETGKIIDHFQDIPPVNVQLRLFPLGAGKVLAVGSQGTWNLQPTSGWCAIIERTDHGIQSKVFFKTEDRRVDWLAEPGKPTTQEAAPRPSGPPPNSAFKVGWITEPPRAAGADRCIYISAYAYGDKSACVVVNVDRLTVTAGKLPHSAKFASFMLTGQHAPLWLNDHECLMGDWIISRVQLNPDHTFADDPRIVLIPMRGVLPSTQLIRQGDKYLWLGERVYSIDPKTMKVVDIGPGVRLGEGLPRQFGSCFSQSANLGLCGFAQGQALYRISIDPAKPLSEHGVVQPPPPVAFPPVAQATIMRTPDTTSFVGPDFMLSFSTHSAQLIEGSVMADHGRLHADDYEKYLRYKELYRRALEWPEERQRVEITAEQYAALQKIPAPPKRDGVLELSRQRHDQLVAMFIAYRQAPTGPEQDKLAKPILDIVMEESRESAKLYADFNAEVEKILSARQLKLLAYQDPDAPPAH